MRIIIAAVLMLITTGVFLGGLIWATQRTNTNFVSAAGTVLTPPDRVRDTTLTNTSNEPMSIGDLNGKYTLLSFGYTHCPDVCPLTLSEFRRVKRELSEDEAEQVNFALISVDGARDTPDLLDRYLERFDPAFIGLTTTDDAALDQLKEDFNLYVEKRVVEGTQASYLMDHTATSFLLNPRGEIIIVYPFGASPVAIAQDLKNLF